MANVQVYLNSVFCGDTEDIHGADEFYIVGATKCESARSIGFSGSSVTIPPMDINDRQQMKFYDSAFGGVNRNSCMIYNDDITSDNGTLRIALRAYDQDSNADWSKYETLRTSITDYVMQDPASFGSSGQMAAALIVQGVGVIVGAIMKADIDDHLGSLVMDIPIQELRDGIHLMAWNISGGSGWYSSWSYVVYYQIRKNCAYFNNPDRQDPIIAYPPYDSIVRMFSREFRKQMYEENWDLRNLQDFGGYDNW